MKGKGGGGGAGGRGGERECKFVLVFDILLCAKEAMRVEKFSGACFVSLVSLVA